MEFPIFKRGTTIFTYLHSIFGQTYPDLIIFLQIYQDILKIVSTFPANTKYYTDFQSLNTDKQRHSKTYTNFTKTYINSLSP